MYPVILQLTDRYAIHSYGVAVALGVFLYIYFTEKHPWRKKLLPHSDTFFNLAISSILAGVIGGKIMYLVSSESTHPLSLAELDPFQGGYSVLGSFLGVFLWLFWQTRRLHIPLLQFLDLASIYAPIAQSVGRIGCFFAGCCHGLQTTCAWAITYTNPQSLAPLNIPLFPIQLVSAAALFGIFLILRYIIAPYARRAGTVFCAYAFLMGLERFCTDFLRDERPMLGDTALSQYQWVSLGIMAGAVVIYVTRSQRSLSRR